MYVRDGRQLEELVMSLRGSPTIALDTEFIRERTYYARLCLIQVANETVAAVVDPLLVSDLSPLLELLNDFHVTKITHAGSQDLEIMYHLTGRVPAPVFDVQIAATLAGFPAQVGYATLVNEICGVKMDKSDTYTDWSRRPLTDTQVEYALNDVRYLPAVYQHLRGRLVDEGRIAWLEPDFDRLVDPATYEIVPEQQFRRVKRMSTLNHRQLGVLMCAAAWREREAQRKNVPRRWVVSDESLIEIARRAPRDASDLRAIRGITGKLPEHAFGGLLAAVAKGVELSEEQLPHRERRRQRAFDADSAVDLMAALARIRAKEHGVAIPLLASREDLKSLAEGERDAHPLLTTWRRSILGEELVALLEGRLALQLKDGKLVVSDVDGKECASRRHDG